MLIKYLFLIFICISLHANNTLSSVYYIDSNDIKLSDIADDISDTEDIKLFNFDYRRDTKKISSKDLINILKKHGYNSYSAKNRYIKFIKKSPIDLSKIKSSIKKFYENNYKGIEINSISVMPRRYVDHLPKEYIVHINDKNILSNKGIVHIKTLQKRKIFFDYTIEAKVFVYYTKTRLKRGEELSVMNYTKKLIQLDKFRAQPVQEIKEHTLQTKHHITADKILTTRDVQTLDLVKRNSSVYVNLYNQSIAITFTAKALQNGKLNDIITVEKSNGTRLKVKVIGKNRAEVR